jgi:hypothetical protein
MLAIRTPGGFENMVTPKIYKLENPEGITFETWSEYGSAVSKMAAGDQPRFAFVITSLTGLGIAWVENGTDAFALADALDHWTGALRQHGTAMGRDPIGKPN